MPKHVHTLASKYLFTIWSFILTVGVVLSLFGLQANSNQDNLEKKRVDESQNIAFCHALADNNQALRDLLMIMGEDVMPTNDMTSSQIESIEDANRRRAGYRRISATLFATPVCPDNYIALSRANELRELVDDPEN